MFGDQQKNWVYLLPVLLAHFVFAAYQLVAGNFLVPEDSYEYIRAAETIRDGEAFCIGGADCRFCDSTGRSAGCAGSDYSYRTPGYPLFILPGLIAGNVEVITIILQNTLSFFCFRTLFLFIQKRKRNPAVATTGSGWKKFLRSDWMLVVLIILSPAHFIYCNFLLAETLLECVLLLFVLETIKYEEEKTFRRLLYAALLLAAAVFIKPVVSVVIIPVLIYFLWKKEIRTHLLSSAFCLLPLAVLLGWSYRNYQKNGRFEYASVSTHNLVSYHVYLTALSSGENPDSVVIPMYQEAKRETSYALQQQKLSTLSRAYLLDHKAQWLKIFFKGIAIMIIDPGRFDTDFFLNGTTAVGGKYMETFHREGMLAVVSDLWEHYGIFLAALLITPIVNLYLLIAFIGFLRNKEIPLQTRLLVFILVAGIFAATGPLGASRFRVPLTMLVLLASQLRMVYRVERKA